MSALWRLFYSLLQQPWLPRAAAVLSGLLLIASVIGWRLHWSYYPTLIEWGLIWAVLAVGAWIINR